MLQKVVELTVGGMRASEEQPIQFLATSDPSTILRGLNERTMGALRNGNQMT